MQQAIASIERLCASDPAFRLFFNLSAVQLEDTGLIDDFVDAANAGVRLENLGVEITETSAMRDVQTTLRFMSVLREHGVNVAIDDFGVGYSSLALLKSFPLDVVKIDRSFVNAVIEDKRDSAIAEAVISFGETFGYVTVAEGVERVEQIDWLRTHGCRFAQGYAICRPLPIDAYLEWYTRNARQVRISD